MPQIIPGNLDLYAHFDTAEERNQFWAAAEESLQKVGTYFNARTRETLVHIFVEEVNPSRFEWHRDLTSLAENFNFTAYYVPENMKAEGVRFESGEVTAKFGLAWVQLP